MARCVTTSLICPLCESWQLDFTEDALFTYVEHIPDPVFRLRYLHDIIDFATWEHLRESH